MIYHKGLFLAGSLFKNKINIKMQNTLVILLMIILCSGATPLLLLPENIRIRRFNLQTEAYHNFLEEEEHIMALDYDWDHNNTGLSKLDEY